MKKLLYCINGHPKLGAITAFLLFVFLMLIIDFVI